MSQQPNYGQQAMSENSWDLVNKAAAASAAAAAANAYNGYPTSAGGLYHRAASNSSNGSHHGSATMQLSPNAGTGMNNSNSGVVQQGWHGVRLPTAPSSGSGTTTAAAEQWLAATNHLQQQHQNLSGMNLSSAMIAPSSNAAVAAAAAAQLYSGNTTSYFATGGGDAGITRPSLLPPTRPQPTGQVLSPTSPMISPTQPLATSWPPPPSNSRGDNSILAKQHHHQFHLPQNHQPEQRSPQQHHHNVAIVHGLNEKASPHYHQQHHAHHSQSSHHQQYPNYPAPSGGPATSAASAAVSSYEKLLEAVVIQAARVPFLNQQQAQTPSAQYHSDAAGGNGEHAIPTPAAHHSSLLELDILRNLAATAGTSGSGHNVPAQHGGQALLPTQQQPSKATFGTNGYGNASSFRPPLTATVKQEPSFCDITPPPATTANSSMPSSELDVAHTMLSIQTCSLQNTVPEYQQISPASAETSQSEMKYRPPTTTSSNANAVQDRRISSNGEDKAFAAITVEQAQSDSDDTTNQPSTKRLKICTTPDIEDRDAEEAADAGTTTGDNADTNHSDVNAQREQAKKTSKDEPMEDREMLDTSPLKESPSPTLLIEHANNGAEDVSPVVSQSSPSNDTPLSVGGRSGSTGSHSSRSSHSGNGSPPSNRVSATATATAVTFGGGNIVLPTVSSTATSAPTMSGSVTHPPGLVGPSPFGAFTAQHAGNHANLHTCHICGFTSPSKFHFNSHMNTHADHKCDYCDYTSRTEGRLKRHMKEFHSPPQLSGANSNDESSGHGAYGGGGNSQFDQSLEEQLQAVVASMTAGSSSGASAFGNVSTTPPAKSSGGSSKSKTYRCKQCEFVAKSKDDYWAHSRAHIKSDKLLTCPKCPFVTEYKHHLEYHLRNHFGSKPFKCVKCNYSCVNKSMLNSHMKSHSNFYQYRCADCTYATKYCHSLKLHLRKYAHTPATTVTPDGGTVVDGTAIDVYGNRRGPRGKKGSDNGSRSSGEGPRTMVSTGGPLSASLPIASPSHLHGNGPSVSGFPTGSGLIPPMTLADSLSQHPATMVPSGPGPSVSASGPLMPAFVEALQTSLLAQQQKDLTAAMVTSIATLGAQLPTIPSLAAAIAAAQNQPGQPSAPIASIPRAESASPGPLSTSGAITPSSVAATGFQMTSPTANIPPAVTPTMKCNLCDFSCTNKETLTKHTMIHMMEKPEQLYQVYSLMASAAAQAQAVAAAAAALATTSQQSTSGSSSCGSTPVVSDVVMKSELGSTGKLVASTTPNALYGGGMLEESSQGRFILSHDASQDSGGSPHSLSGGKGSGDEGVGNESFMNPAASAGGAGAHRQRRKGRAFKLDRIALKLQGKNCDDADTESITETGNGGEFENVMNNRSNIGTRHTRSTSPATGCGSSQSMPGHRVNRSESVSSVSGVGRPNFHHVGSSESLQNPLTQAQQTQRHLQSPATLAASFPSPMGRPTNIDWSNAYVCNYCEIAFKDCIMYTMHMGFHGYQDPYKCNTCGHVSDDPRSMFLHIAREPHL